MDLIDLENIEYREKFLLQSSLVNKLNSILNLVGNESGK